MDLPFDSLEAIILWSHSIHRSHMRAREERACLAPIIQHCPRGLDELRLLPSPHAEELWWELADIASELGTYDNGNRGRTKTRLSSTRGFSPPYSRLRSRTRAHWGGSLSPSPNRRLLAYGENMLDPGDRLMLRSRSAPGDRSVARQANRVIDLAEGTIEEAEILKRVAKDAVYDD